MTLTLELPEDVRARLADKAKAVGVDLPTYAQRVLEGEAFGAPLSEILRPVREAFNASGRSETELTAELEEAKREMRSDRRTRAANG